MTEFVDGRRRCAPWQTKLAIAADITATAAATVATVMLLLRSETTATTAAAHIGPGIEMTLVAPTPAHR